MNTLDLDPEWGAIDLIEEIEKEFSFRMSKDEAERCATVGDLYAVVCDQAPDWDAQGGMCASSMTFYRIRHSLHPDRSQRITPKTDLSGHERPFRLFKQLSYDTRLRFPSPRSTSLGIVGGLIFTFGLLAGVTGLLTGFWTASAWAFAFGALGIPLLVLDRGKLPSGVVTVGDLVRRAAPLNTSALRNEGARPSDRWSVVTSLAAEHGLLPPDEITSETFLHRKSLELALAA